MKKIAKIIYSAAFFSVCCIPLATTPFVKSSGEIEKKELSEMPKLISDGKLNTDFSEEFDDWYNDRLPFRSQLLTAANFIKSEALSTTTANVITGKDGWLFYESTADDFMDLNAMSDEQLKSIAVTMSLLQEKVENGGGSFVFVPMPNKNSIYGEYMPSCYTQADENNLTRLYGVLDDYGINYVNMRSLMLENKSLGLYHKRDTHWNYLGALLGFNAIMDGLGTEHKTYNSVEYTIGNNWRGDLDKLLYPVGGFYDEEYSFDIDYEDFTFTIPAGVTDTQAQLENFMSDKEENDTRFRTKKTVPTNGNSLYMVRDSFGRALLPFMIDNYDTAMFVRTNCPEMSMLAPGGDMVYEIVERNLTKLIETAPFMSAPQRDVSITGEKTSDKNKLYTSSEAYGFRIYGVIDEELLGDDSRIYVRLENDENSYTLEAFPIYETDLLADKENDSQCGFSLILTGSDIVSGDYSASVISGEQSSGKLAVITYEGE